MNATVAQRPDICIKCAPGVQLSALRNVQLGMEEEGIPFHLAAEEARPARELAKSAADESRLDVGVGIDANYLVLTHAKLEESKPLFEVAFSEGDEAQRSLGANAARLVKRTPFKM